jgi:beta-lactamase superfamily II metal-dependent hydrolase
MTNASLCTKAPTWGQAREDDAMTNEVGFEIDFLPVGNGDRSGDAIALRYGTPGNYKVMVYDGGTQDSGKALVEHIRNYYGTNRVDYMISSHPDTDHVYGLSVVLEQLYVEELWIHQPWKYSPLILKEFEDARITYNSLEKRLKENMKAAHDLELLARKHGTRVKEPFVGEFVGPFRVLSPGKNWYIYTLIPEFNKSPEQKKPLMQPVNYLAGIYGKNALPSALTGYSGGIPLSNALSSFGVSTGKSALTNVLMGMTGREVSRNIETWGTESLREDMPISGENESSVILFGKINGHGIMLTGDAGVRGLTTATNYAESLGISLPQELNFIQIPHHGSRHNVSTQVLDRIVGRRKPTDDGNPTKIAFVSAGKDSKTHPRRMVVNAFIRRGAKVFATQGYAKRHSKNMPPRSWNTATPLPFSNQVESWD